jgi:hypothetical protein
MSPNPIFGSLTQLVLKLAITTPVLVALVAFSIRFARGGSGWPRVLNAWIIATAGSFVWVAFDLATARTGHAFLPRLPVPGFHFLAYAMSLASLGFGMAVGDLAAWSSKRLHASGVPLYEGATAIVLLGVVLAVAAPRYVRRPDATELLADARKLQSAFPEGLYAWARSSTAPDDVFLCTDAESLYVISPAGRKVVATNRYFSNPFVDWSRRDADRGAMFDALGRGDASSFARLASRYGVRFIVVPLGLNDELRRLSGMPKAAIPTLTPDAVAGLPGIARAWSDERYTVFRYGGD